MDERVRFLEKTDSTFVKKRLHLVIACLLRMFLTGVEYSVILPSVWLYLKTFHVGAWFLGLVGAGYSLATMVSLPVAGRFYDRTKKARELILIMNTFEIVGNITYALPFSAWLPLLGRLLAGMGDGFYVVTFSEIPALIRRKSITRMFAILELGSILGIVLGPSFNLFLAKANFWIGKWHINFATSPGLFMATVWILMQILTVFMITNMSLKYKPRKGVKSRLKKDSVPHGTVEKRTENPDDEKMEDKDPLLGGGEEESRASELDKEADKGTKKSITRKHSVLSPTFKESLSEICSIDVAVIIFNDCVLWLSQIQFEILAPIIGEEDMGFTEVALSYFYIIGGIQLLAVFCFLWILSGRVYDIHYSMCSAVMTSIALVLMVLYQIERHRFTLKLVLACCIAFLVFSSIPLNLVAGRAVLVKITKEYNQGFVIGIYSAVCRIALVLGPILGSASYPNLAPLGCVMLIFCLVALVGLILRKNHIIERQLALEMQQLFADQ